MIRIITLSLYICSARSFADVINKLLSELDIKHPNIITSLSSNEEKHLLKEMSYTNNYMKILRINDNNMENNNIVLINNRKMKQQDIQLFLNHKSFHKMLIINPYSIKSYEELSIDIGQEVYFFDESSAEVFETYEINGMKIRGPLGLYNATSNSFTWNANKNQIIFRRRGNFHGLKLKGMVEHSMPSVLINNKYKEKARFFQSNQTYLMNGFVKGVYIDILEHLQENLNFSTTLYKRKVRSFGNMKDWNN